MALQGCQHVCGWAGWCPRLGTLFQQSWLPDVFSCCSRCSSRRDRLAVITQLLVPMLLVVLAMAVSTVETQRPQQPPLQLCRATCLMGRPALLAAAPGLRQQQEVQGFMDGYPR